MINTWIPIDPLIPLPSEEVLCVDLDGTKVLGRLERITFTRFYCRGNFEELQNPTHYMITNNPNR